MTNVEKTEHIEQMLNERMAALNFCLAEKEKGTAEWHVDHAIIGYRQDIAALKYALKGIRLIKDLCNDLEKGGEQ